MGGGRPLPCHLRRQQPLSKRIARLLEAREVTHRKLQVKSLPHRRRRLFQPDPSTVGPKSRYFFAISLPQQQRGAAVPVQVAAAPLVTVISQPHFGSLQTYTSLCFNDIVGSSCESSWDFHLDRDFHFEVWDSLNKITSRDLSCLFKEGQWCVQEGTRQSEPVSGKFELSLSVPVAPSGTGFSPPISEPRNAPIRGL